MFDKRAKNDKRTTKKPIEFSTEAVDYWLASVNLKLQTDVINRLLSEVRQAIERALDQSSKSSSVQEKACPRCGGDLLEYGARPFAPGSREADNSWKCNRCHDWYFQDSVYVSFSERDKPENVTCPLCDSDMVNYRYGGVYRHGVHTYADFQASDNNTPNPEKMKTDDYECKNCGLSWALSYCIACNSKNTHRLAERLHPQGGKSWWSYMQLYACFDCGKTWYTSPGGSD